MKSVYLTNERNVSNGLAEPPLEPATTRAAPHPIVVMEHLGVRFETPNGSVDAITDVNLQVNRGEFVVIVGPSGCGKSTLLRSIAGLEEITEGSVTFPSANESQTTNALVFQGRSVFPWRTVSENIAYGLDARGVSKSERSRLLHYLLDVTGLAEFSRAYPHQISEGMRQRVAIARALAVDPEMLLMDEPFGALDEQTRYLLQEELLKIWESSAKTVVFVTHSIDEALTLADRIVVMTAHPGTIKAIFDVPFSRPRELTAVRSNPESARLFTEIWHLLRDEVNQARLNPGQER